MQRSGIYALALAAMAGLVGASTAKAVVFGSFEGSQSDGFGSYSNSGVQPFASDATTTYTYSSAGATSGTTGLTINHSGFANTLEYSFLSSNTLTALKANNILSFDVTFPAAGAATAGYNQIYAVQLQSDAGTVSSSPNPTANQYYFSGFAGSTQTVTFDYTAFKAALPATPTYVNLIIVTNNGGGAPSSLSVDNFQLTTAPEPASLSLLSLAGVGALARRRRA